MPIFKMLPCSLLNLGSGAVPVVVSSAKHLSFHSPFFGFSGDDIVARFRGRNDIEAGFEDVTSL